MFAKLLQNFPIVKAIGQKFSPVISAIGAAQQAAKAPTPAPSNPNGVSSSTRGGQQSVGTERVDKSNDIALQLAGLNALDQQTSQGVRSVDDALNRLIAQYNTESSSNEGNYGNQSTNNQLNLQKNKQTALVNASQGRQGLFGTLSSLGALNGSGVQLANQAVQKAANQDLAGAGDNYNENQTQLDTAINTFRQQDKMRRENAQTAAENAKTNINNEAARNRQTFYGNLANNYAAMGNQGEAGRYTQLASSLFPEVARTNVPNSNIAYSGAAFTPGSLSNYLSGADSSVVSATPTKPGERLPGLVASPTKRKQQLM